MPGLLRVLDWVWPPDHEGRGWRHVRSRLRLRREHGLAISRTQCVAEELVLVPVQRARRVLSRAAARVSRAVMHGLLLLVGDPIGVYDEEDRQRVASWLEANGIDPSSVPRAQPCTLYRIPWAGRLAARIFKTTPDGTRYWDPATDEPAARWTVHRLTLPARPDVP